MQTTGRMAGQAGPSVFQAVAALLIATVLVVGLTLAAQRISIHGSAVAAPAPDAAAVQQALNAQRLGEKGALTGGTDGRLGVVSSSIARPVYMPFEASDFRISEKGPLTSPDEPDGIRRGTITHR